MSLSGIRNGSSHGGVFRQRFEGGKLVDQKRSAGRKPLLLVNDPPDAMLADALRVNYQLLMTLRVVSRSEQGCVSNRRLPRH